METWVRVLGWRKSKVGEGGLCTFYPQGSLSVSSHGAPREMAFPSKHTIHQDFLGRSSSFWATRERKVTENGQDRTSVGQNLQNSSPQRKGFVMALCLTELPILHSHLSSDAAGKPPPRISPSSGLCSHTCSHKALLPLSLKISSRPSLCLIIPRLDQEEAEGNVLSL